jgi:hypothetical protein
VPEIYFAVVKDVCSLGLLGGIEGDWVGDMLEKKLGKGDKTSFWHDKWCGLLPLKDIVPRIFGVSECQNGMVIDMGVWWQDLWHWKLVWRRPLFVWEDDHLLSLLDLLHFVNQTN